MGIPEDALLMFYDVGGKVRVNSCPLADVRLVPHGIGETVLLPGIQGQGAGSYKVVDVYHEFYATGQDLEHFRRITIHVRKESKAR